MSNTSRTNEVLSSPKLSKMPPYELNGPDGKPQEDIVVEDESQPIRLMACDCNNLFDQCLARSSVSEGDFYSQHIQFIKEYCRRFNAWSSFLGVFANKNASLDNRLRRHPALQDMIMRLLDMLRRNLFLVTIYETRDSKVETTDRIHSKFNVTFSGIKESITGLNKLGIVIRSSSRSTATARARRFALQYPKLILLSDFEDMAYIALHCLYPNSPESLREQLVDTMTDRYAKLKYEAYRTGKAQTPAQLSAMGGTNDGKDVVTKDSSELDQQTGDVTDKKDTPFQEHQRHPTEVPASSIDTARLYTNLEQTKVNTHQSKTSKTITGHNGRDREPDLPEFKEGEDYTSCDWCFKIIDKSLIQIKPNGHTEWSNKGRQHYRHDLQPYVCIAEGCRDSRPTYSSSREWFNHMLSTHSEHWLQDIHNQPLWTCIAKHDNDSPYMFSSRNELDNHIRLLHRGPVGHEGSGKVEAVNARYGIECLRQMSTCPLCLFSLQASLTQGTESTTSRKTTTYMDNVGKKTEITSWEMGSHIADHLHHLMIVSLQIFSSMRTPAEGDDDTRSLSSGPSVGISGSDGDQARKRLEDLPEDLQGSIDWSDMGRPEDEHLQGQNTMYTEPRMRRPEDYTVGWVCMLPVEMTAAREMLDDEHPSLDHKLSNNDENLYLLGSIDGHDVAIACPPVGQIGSNSVAATATQMRATFKDIQFVLMVGVSGGVPSTEVDIRLGDVVVSMPHQTSGGVVQYDRGKMPSSGFVQTGMLRPPEILLEAVARVQTQMELGMSNFVEYASQLDRIPEFTRSNAGPDVLFEAAYDHVGGQTCEMCSIDRQVVRQPRASEEESLVHYGIIASGNYVMRDGLLRDKTSTEFGGVLCFEIEAAGLTNYFPCLLIRGICDYADSHKNERWQAYAAGRAAAYAKELLLAIPAHARIDNQTFELE